MANDQFTSVACGTDYTPAATVRDVYDSGGGVFEVQDQPVTYGLQYGGLGADNWTPEATIGTGGGSIPAGVTGVRFRNAVPGQVATVSALIRPRSQPHLALAFAVSGTSSQLTGIVSSAGAVVAGTGFTCARTGPGQYTITFTAPSPFTAAPGVYVSSLDPGLSRAAPATNPAAAAAAIVWRDLTGTLADTDFSFVALTTA